MILLIQYTLLFASVLMLVALGGCFSEHSGVINLGLEGIMVMGALGGALVMKYLPAGTAAIVIVLSVILASMLMGLIYSALLGVAGVNFSADQTLVGTAMNMLAAALATVIVKSINVAENPDNVSSTVQYVQAKRALIVNVGGFQFNWFMLVAVILLVASHFILYKTRFGLRLMACGEHPAAADSVGINVKMMRWAGVLISGLLGGLGGIVYITAGVSEWKFETGVAGFGFLALAVMIFGQWKPVNIALAALLFGFFRALSNVYKMRWAGVLISGALGGLGGLVYITAGVSQWKFENGVAGFGFLALAVMIFGQWKPKHIAWAALLFGMFRALSNVYSGFDFLARLNIPSGIYNMLPYIVSLIVLAFTSKNSAAPKAEGIPYDKGSR